MIRPECGTVDGLRAHQGAQEWPCGWCVHAESVARLAAERHAPLPWTPDRELLEPVTPERAAANAAVLDREVAAFDRGHKRDGRSRWLRSVA